MLSFVCSIGNVPFAAVLWNGGISFGGVVSFIFADLIVLPILNIYRKYYGRRVSLYLLATFYAAMVFAGLLVEILFGALGLIPDERDAKVVEASVTWNYTTFLNPIFIALSAVLVVRLLRTGGPAMLRMMGGQPELEHQPTGHTPHAMTPRPSPQEGGTYTCPMHPEVVSDQPGRCPKCGMALERA
jgi:uncharacterized membrane protein YraQ (UPF0718 family)